MNYTVYVECDEETLSEGGYLAHIAAVPGCVGRGPTIDEAVARCRENLSAYLALLLEAGASGVPSESEEIELEVDACTSHTFDSDYSILMPSEAGQLVQWMEVSRDELLETVSKLPPDAIDWKPEPDAWAIRNVLRHIANSDHWYVTRMVDYSIEWPVDVYDRLATSRSLLVEALRHLTDVDRDHVTLRDGEQWTWRKVVRRALEHEREHIEHIRELAEQYHAAHAQQE